MRKTTGLLLSHVFFNVVDSQDNSTAYVCSTKKQAASLAKEQNDGMECGEPDFYVTGPHFGAFANSVTR